MGGGDRRTKSVCAPDGISPHSTRLRPLPWRVRKKNTPIIAFFYLILELLGGHWLPLFIIDGQAQLTKSLKSFFYDIAHDKAYGA